MSDTLTIPLIIAEQAAVLAGTVSQLKLVLAMEGCRQNGTAESMATLHRLSELTGMKASTIRRTNEALHDLSFRFGGVEASVLGGWSPITRPDWAINRFVHVEFSEDWEALAARSRDVVELPVSDLRNLTTKAGLLLTLRFLAAFDGGRQRATLEMRPDDMPLFVGDLGVAPRMAAAVRVHIEPGCAEINRVSHSLNVTHRVITRGEKRGAHVGAVEFHATRLHRREPVSPPMVLRRPLATAPLDP